MGTIHPYFFPNFQPCGPPQGLYFSNLLFQPTKSLPHFQPCMAHLTQSFTQMGLGLIMVSAWVLRYGLRVMEQTSKRVWSRKLGFSMV